MMVAGLLVCLPLHYLWKLFGKASPWPRHFLGWVGRSAGMRVRVHGTPLKRHVLFLANHLSWLDIMLIAGASGTAFVAKDDIAKWPVFGWLARLNNTIFIARSQRGSVRDQADTLRAALASGQPVTLFPEGTTEGGREVLPFRPSLLASLFPPLPSVKVQPVALDYGAAGDDIAWVGEEPAGVNAKRVLRRKGSSWVDISFLPPLDPHQFPERKSLSDAARRAILDALPPSDGTRDAV